jgi:hypothetical protein
VPNKTLYVKDSDLPLFEQAQEQLGESVSSLFADFLRERVAKITPEENKIAALLEQVRQQRTALAKERGLPRFLEAELAEAEASAEKALKSIRRGEVRQTKIHFYAANLYRDKAERDLKEARELSSKLSAMSQK